MSEPSVLPIEESEKHLLRNLMQAYRHGMSEFDRSNPDESGLFDVGDYFDVYWTEPARRPFKVLVGDVLAGFALVRGRWALSPWISKTSTPRSSGLPRWSTDARRKGSSGNTASIAVSTSRGVASRTRRTVIVSGG